MSSSLLNARIDNRFEYSLFIGSYSVQDDCRVARASYTIISTHAPFLGQNMILSEVDMKCRLIGIYTLTKLISSCGSCIYINYCRKRWQRKICLIKRNKMVLHIRVIVVFNEVDDIM